MKTYTDTLRNMSNFERRAEWATGAEIQAAMVADQKARWDADDREAMADMEAEHAAERFYEDRGSWGGEDAADWY
jgi:hypothetical protein